MKRDLKALQRRRLRAIRLLKKGVNQADVARQLGVSRQSVSRWATTWSNDGDAALKAKPVGRPAGLDEGQRRELIKVLKRGAVLAGYPTELWTLPRVRDVIAQRFGRRYNEAHVSRLLKGLGFSCQRPTGRAVQRDEATIRQWKQQRWPALKKTPKNKAKPSSSSTSPD
jgi:transposase